MLRSHFIKKSINQDNIKHVVGHSATVYLKSSIRTLVGIFLLYVIYSVFVTYVDFKYTNWIFGVLGLALFLKYLIDFLNLYLDGLALLPGGLTLFMWEGLLEHKTEHFYREKILAIKYNQKGLWDKIFCKGDILICLEQGIEFPFENVSYPKKEVSRILKLRDLYTSDISYDKPEEIKHDDNIEEDKMKIFMEAFSEVMKDYMDKGDKKD